METNLLDRMLATYLSSNVAVTVTLQNKIRVSGLIKAFDSYVIIMEGQKREIVYRHAVSSLAASAAEEPKKKSAAPSAEKQPSRPARTSQKNRTPQQASLSASSSETSINSSMKEGLLKWIQEQKATK